MEDIARKHPLIEKNWSTLIFLNAAYEGKSSWFKDYPMSLGGTGTSFDYNPMLANCFLPIESVETLPQFKNNYFKRLKRSRWEPLFKKTIKSFCGILTNYSVNEGALGWLSLEKKQQYLSNIDLEGNDHYSFFAECDRLALLEGWCAVWVNSSHIKNQPSNYSEQRKLNYRPYVQIIKRSQIIDFDSTRLLNGQKVLTKLVYEEEIYKDKKKTKRYIKVLPGEVHTYEEIKKDNEITKIELIEEQKYDLDYIPIVFYPVNNFSPWDIGFPFLEIAEANKCHYQIYSDYRESLHYQSLPVFVRTGILQPSQKPSSLDPVIISPLAVLDLPENGDFKVVETSGVAINLNKDALKDIEGSVISEALNFIDSGSSMTATEANLRSIQFQASFDVYASQKTSAISEIFTMFAHWMGFSESDQAIIINDAVFKLTSPELIREFRGLLSEGFLDIETFWELLNSWGVLPKTVDVKEIIERTYGTIRESQAPRETIEPEPIARNGNGDGN